jgi:subtilisin family serine protease
LAPLQYALAKVDAFRAWEYETGFSSRVTIAVVDSGVEGIHPDLSAKFANTTSVAYDPNSGAIAVPNDPLTPACEHATEVAGVAAASSNNARNIAGISWGAQLVSYKVFLDADCNSACCSPNGDCSNSSTCQTNDPAIISAINQAKLVNNTANYGRMIVNLSLGGTPTTTCAADDPALQTAVTNAVNAGVVIVAAAGNDAGPVNSPGYCTGVIPVGATDSNDAIAYFSSHGVELSSGVVAPGVSVLTTHTGGGTSSPSGTSFSSPMVAGAAALILSAKPTLTPDQVRTHLRAGADSLGLSDRIQGAGRLNVYKSVGLAATGSLPAANGVNVDAKPYAFPNPLRLSKEGGVQISIPPGLQGSALDIKIYTADGVLVRDLSTAVWDGRNTNGVLVASGSYVFVVKTSGGSARGRLAVIR